MLQLKGSLTPRHACATFVFLNVVTGATLFGATADGTKALEKKDYATPTANSRRLPIRVKRQPRSVSATCTPEASV